MEWVGRAGEAMNVVDNWGDRARIGLFIVGREVVPEAEWWAMRPAGVSVHAARVTSASPWAPWTADGTGAGLSPDLSRGCRDFTAIAVDVAVLAHSSSSFVGGPGWDEAAVAALAAELPAGTTATTNGLDMRLALAALGSKRPFLVMPAWMSDALVASAVAYLEAHGFAAPAAWRYRPLDKWRGIPPDGLYPAGMATDQDTGSLFDQVVRECPADADSILLAGTGLRCVAIIEALETALGRPVVTANQASLWRALQAAGVDARVDGYGVLLRG
jgi:maleate isomerase